MNLFKSIIIWKNNFDNSSSYFFYIASEIFRKPIYKNFISNFIIKEAVDILSGNHFDTLYLQSGF